LIDETPIKTCSNCEGTNLKHGKLMGGTDHVSTTYGKGSMSYGGRFWSKVYTVVCTDCGNLHLHIKKGTTPELITRIANQLRKEFERWPRKSKISLPQLAINLGLGKSLILPLINEVYKQYPQFRQETIEDTLFLIKKEYY
jgi:hypothetical protein